MPLRRGFGGLSSGAGGNLFDRPGFFDQSEITNLTVETQLLLKAASETYGILIAKGDTSGASATYTLTIPDMSANAELVTTNATQTLTNKTLGDLRLTEILDSNGLELIKFTATGSAVNELTLANASTGNPPVLSATGGDTNIGITLTPKGSGIVRITGGLTVDGTTTTLNSTTLTIDDKNITLGSVSSPSDTTADGGGITLKGASDKTIIWDNANDNWTSNQDWNLASGTVFRINNVSMLSNTTLGSSVINSSLTSTGVLAGGSIAAGFGTISTGNAITTTAALTGGSLVVDNITINGNTISSTSGQIIFDATTTLDFGDDSVLNIETLTIDAIHGDDNAIQIGDNSDDAVSIYRVNALTAIGDLDIGAHDLRAATLTADTLTSGRVPIVSTSGLLIDDSGFEYATGSNTLTVGTLTPTNINAFTLGGKLTAGTSEIEGSNFDITGGTIDGVTATSFTLNSGTIGGDLTWSAAQSMGDVALTGVNIDGGTVNDITVLGIKQATTGYEVLIALGSTSLTADRTVTIEPNDAARNISLSGNLTLANNFITSGNYATTLTTTGTTGVTLPTTGTLATLTGNETLVNKALTQPAIANFTSATHTHTNDASGGTVAISSTTGTLAVARGGTGATSLSNLITLSTHTTGDYVATITGGTGITSTGATSGEGIAHSLSVDSSQTGITAVGDLDGGSITSNFGSINIGTSALTAGAINIGGDVTTAAAQDWDLVDNNASALSFDAAGKAGILELDTRNGAERVTMSGGLVVTGDFTVNGTTTIVNSTTVTVDDPIFTIGGDSAPGSDDNKDRGIAFRWHDGSAAKIGFFGYDDSAGKMTFVPDATINSEVVSGTAGTIVATTFEGALNGTAATATEATNVTVTANDSTDETTYLTFVDGATGTQGIETDTGLHYNPSTGVLTAGSFSGTSAVADDSVTNAKLANMAANTIKVRNANSSGDPSDLAVADTQIVIGDGTGFTAAALGGDVRMTNAGVVTIQADKILPGMLSPTIIASLTDIGGSTTVANDYVMVWDATDSELKKSSLAQLGISGTAAGSASEVQYNNSGSFAGASNVEIKNNSLALKEQATPSAVSGYGMIYAKTDNELYYRSDTSSEVKLTDAGAIAGGGSFRGMKVFLNADLAITSGTVRTLGTGSYGTWTETGNGFDLGAFHSGSTNTDRFTFGGTGYYQIAIQQEWDEDSAGYREMKVTYRDVSGSSDIVLLRDRVVAPSNQTTVVSGGSTIVYVDDASDYFTIQVYQNSGADLNIEGGAVDSTFVTITRLDLASSTSVADGASGRIQISDGSGGFTSDGDLTFSTDTLTATKLGAFTAAGAIDFDNQDMTNVDIDSGDIASAVTINKSPTITLTGEVTASATTMTNLGNVSIATVLDNTSISGQDALTSGLATTDELLVSDAGTIKKMDMSVLYAATATLTNKTFDVSATGNSLSNVPNASLSNSSITVSDGSNTTAIALGGTATFAAGEGIDVAESSGTVTFSGEDATTSNKGVASFSSDNFAVSSGAVTIKDSGVSNDELAGSIANAKLANSAVTIGSTSTALGATSTAIAGLTGLDLTSGDKTIFATIGANTLTMGASGTTIAIPGNLTVTGTTTTVDTVTMKASNALAFEGVSDNTIETILTVIDPTSADKTITLPNLTGHVGLFDATSTTLITATPAEINVLDGATAGASVVSKAMVLDSNGDFEFQDSDVLAFGNSGDLKIYHDGSNSFINDQGTGQIVVIASAFNVNNAANNASMITMAEGGATSLYYNGSAKFATTNTGVSVTGTGVFSTSIDVTGSAGIILENDETITNSTDGAVLISGKLVTGAGGSTSACAIQLGEDVDTGLIIPGTDQVGIVGGGVETVRVGANYAVIASAAEPTLIFMSDSDANSSDNDSIIRFKRDSTDYTGAATVFSIRDDQGNGALSFEDANGVAMRMATGGNVDINGDLDLNDNDMVNVGHGDNFWTDAGMYINSGATNAGLTLESTDAGSYIYLKDNSTSATSYIGVQGNNTVFQKAGTNKMLLDANGNLAIGTSSPVANHILTVDGKTRTEDIKYIQVALTAPAGDAAVGTPVAQVAIPADMAGMNLVEARAVCATAPAGAATTINIRRHEDDQNMCSTIDIATSARTSTGGSPDASYDDVAVDDMLHIDVASVGATPAKGVIVTLGFAFTVS